VNGLPKVNGLPNLSIFLGIISKPSLVEKRAHPEAIILGLWNF